MQRDKVNFQFSETPWEVLTELIRGGEEFFPSPINVQSWFESCQDAENARPGMFLDGKRSPNIRAAVGTET